MKVMVFGVVPISWIISRLRVFAIMLEANIWEFFCLPPPISVYRIRWWFQIFRSFTPKTGEMIQFWRAYFSNGLKPPTRFHFLECLLIFLSRNPPKDLYHFMCILKITHDSFFLNLTASNFPAHAGATLGDNYDQRLNHVNLPSALQTLTFGEAFNRRLDDVIFPSSLKTLTFGDCFNQSLKDVNFPKSLRHLSFGFNFNQSLQISWPKNLQTLTLDYMFNQSLDDVNLPCRSDLFSWWFLSFFCFTMVNHQFSPPFESISRWWQLKYFFIFTPKIWGRWTQFDGAHIFQMGWKLKPPTRYESFQK